MKRRAHDSRGRPLVYGRLGQGQRKLAEDDVRLIRELSREGMKQREIAAKFEVSQSTVSDVVNRVTSIWIRSKTT